MRKPGTWHSLPEYHALRAIMQAGTTTAAAERLGLSQSAVSRSLANLENRFGTPLFEREAGRLRPTEDAVRLNRRLDPLFEALDRIDGPTEPVQETLRLIAPPTYSHRFMISLINSFLTINPNVYVSFEVNTSDEVVRSILEERFDLGISGVEQNRAGIKLLPYRRAQAVCVMLRDHMLAERDVIRPEDLHDQRFIALTQRHARRGQLDRLLHQAGAVPQRMAEVSTSFAAADLVREGLGITVINPFPLYQYRADDLVFIPFASPIHYESHFVTAANRPVPRAARVFMRHMRLNTPPDPFSSRG